MFATGLHEAYLRGDVTEIRQVLGDPEGFPNVGGGPGSGSVLEYAIYHSPIDTVRDLLDLGADPNYADHGGFPSVIAALSADHREDRSELVTLLLDRGADIEQRGLNDWTPLHYAAASRDFASIDLLLERGADVESRTHIDDRATPAEEAQILGHADVAEYLERRRA